jgi:transcriptional regulator with XRE-family HTH domain
MSQGDLAVASGVAKQAISNLERGSVVASIRTIEALCIALKLNPLDVLQVGFGLAPAQVTALQHQIAAVLGDLSPVVLNVALAQLKVLGDWNTASTPSDWKDRR